MDKKKTNNSVADDLFKTLLAPVSGPSAVAEEPQTKSTDRTSKVEVTSAISKQMPDETKESEKTQLTAENDATDPSIQEQYPSSGSEQGNTVYGNYRPLSPANMTQTAQTEAGPVPEAAMSYAAARRFRKKRPLRNCRTTISLTEEVREKADRAIDNGEIRSLNDLINYLLTSYFNQNQ